jgi:Subtilase family/Peptidase inhibitor I9
MPLVSRRGITALAIPVGLIIAGITAGAAQAAPRATAVPRSTSHVIVLLRDQHTNLPMARGHISARVSANRAAQRPVIARARSLGARNLHGFQSISGFAATLTPAQAARLASDPSVARILPDLTIRMGPSLRQAISRTARAARPATVGSQVCPSDPAKPLLEPEALQLTNTAFTDPSTPQAQNIVDGTGVKVGYIADGIDINNPDFIRLDGSHVFVDYQDFSGDGLAAPSGAAEAFGDASSIAAQGHQTYDLSNFVNPAHPLPPGCNITVRGIAPGASLVGLKVFGNSNTAPTSRFIQAIDYAVNVAGVDVLNESFGANPFPDNGDDPISLADEAAVAAGVTVTVSTGDAGTNGTVQSPSSIPDVISAGATTQFRSYIQTTGAGAQLSNGTWVSNNISALSSGGITQQARVPDLVAPGDLGWALCTPNTALYTECTDDKGVPSPIQDFGGTSESAPLTAGAAALVIEAYKNTHHGVRPSPALVKRFLTSTATDQGHPAFEQGAGLLNTLGAVQAAESWKDGNGSPAATGTNLVLSHTQLSISGDPGSSATSSVRVRNVSDHTQVVHAATRMVGKTVSSVNGTDTLNTATAPAYIDAFGISRSYVPQTFTVGPNVDRLDVSNAASLPTGFSIRVILVDPHGTYTAYSIPQGFNNFSHVDVTAPMPGTWTMFSAASTSSHFNGPVFFNVTQSDFTPKGTVTPATMTLAPGESGDFDVHEHLASTPGDVSASLQLTGQNGNVTTSVPVTIRTVIPDRNTSFSGVITGGNGRAQLGPAQTNLYYLEVPPGKRDLSVGFTFSDPAEVVFGVLTAPDGQVYSFQSNTTVDGSGNLAPSNGLQIYRRDPRAGQWILSLNVTNPVSGHELFQSFSAQVAYNTVRIHASPPDSGGTKLAAGVPVNVPVQITNTGVQTLTFFADPRLKTVGTIGLAELSGNSTVPLPVPAGITPFWLVPTETQQLTETVTADQPVNADFFYNSGDPDQYSAAVGDGATVQVKARQVSPGLWLTDIGQNGPFTGPAPAGTATVSAQAVGNLFDPAVTSTTGDLWQAGVAASTDHALAAQLRANGLDVTRMRAGLRLRPADVPPPPTGPVTLAPGQSATITVTITPSGSTGTVVRGTLYIDDFNNFTDGGDELAAIPYRYKIG